MGGRLILFLALVIAGPSEAPWYGTWKLNPAKSGGSSESRYKRVLLKIEPWGDGIRVRYDMVGIRGGVNHMEWTGQMDGKDYPLQGLDYVMTNAYSPVDQRSYRIRVKVDGVLAASVEVSVSADGKTLTTVSSEKNARGETISSTSVYERVR